MATPDETSSFTGADTSEDEEEVVETLVAGRQKRSTAGRNMSSLLDAAADDDLTLLFAEDENDEEFDEREGGGDAEFDDMRLDSSSEDDDDNGPNAAEDDLEGEKELEKQARVDRKKRKAQESLRLTALRKKVKLDLPARSSASATTTTPRPKKKSERVSWLPTTEEGPVRSSSRRQTMQNKELTHARLKDSEQRRIKLIANMEEAAKRKQRLKPKVMTQEERLAEAAKIERLNSKSLNRWEEMEKGKAEERKAKLEALQNRRLEGPVMSWWSGIAKWVNGNLVRVGNVEVKPKPKPEEKEPDRKKKASKDAATLDAPKVETAESSVVQPLASTETTTASTTIQADGPSGQQQVATTQIQRDKATGTQGFLDGIHQYASETATPVPESEPNAMPDAMPDAASATAEEATSETVRADNDQKLEVVDEGVTKDRENTADGKEENNTSTTEAKDASESNPADEKSAPGVELQADASHPPDVAVEPEKAPEIDPSAENTAQTEHTLMDDVDPSTVDDKPPVEASKTDTAPPSLQRTEAADISMHEDISLSVIDQSTSATELVGGKDEAEAPVRPDEIEHTGRNLLVLENFDNATINSREFSIYFNAKKPPRLTKISSHLCPITSQLSRYRDPATGLPFADVIGYQEIRNLTEQKYTWSEMLGCYIGSATVAAKGVPEQFITGVKPQRKTETTATSGETNKDNEPERVKV